MLTPSVRIISVVLGTVLFTQTGLAAAREPVEPPSDSHAAWPSSEEAPLPATGDPDRDRTLRLQASLRDIVKEGFGRCKVGLRVIEANSGKVVFGRGTTALMDPASNQKVLATTTALVRLGTDWTFHTDVYGPPPDAEGVVHGDLFLRGSGDPTLDAHDLGDLVDRLVAHGITAVTGGVVADPRRFGDDRPLARLDDDHQAAAQLAISRGIIAVRVRPAETGAPAHVIFRSAPSADLPGVPPSIVVSNRVRTVDGRQKRLAIDVSTTDGVLRIDVSGRIGADHRGVVYRRRVPDKALTAAILLRAALIAAGVTVREQASVGTLPPPSTRTVLAEHTSAPLGVLLRKINKDSDNYEAERLLETVGAEMLGGAPTTEKGITVLRGVIGEFGLNPHSYVPTNGSGLGHANRISAQAMTELLRALYLDPRVGPDLVQSLSVGGVDGTTRNRFRGMPVARQVRAKTGTLLGKSCLSGLVGDGGEVMAFSIMVQGFKTRHALSAVREAQVAAVNTMMRYVQERDGARPPATTPAAVVLAAPGTDYETGGEIDTEAETEEEFEDEDAAAVAEQKRASLPVPAAADDGGSLTFQGSRAAAPLARVELGIGGLGSFASGDTALGGNLFMGLGRKGPGFESAIYATAFHDLAGPGSGSTEWTRLGATIGPRYRFTSRMLTLDVKAVLAAGWFWVHGHDYMMNSTSRTLAVGGGLGARLCWNQARVSPTVGLDAIGWPGRHEISVVGVTETRAIPSVDLMLSLGARFRLW